MGKQQGYQFNGIAFARKEDVTLYIRDILHRYPEGAALSVNDFDFMMTVLDNHPDVEQKIGGGVASMQVRQNERYPANRNFWIIRHDGTETDFSFTKCLYPRTKLQDIMQACRIAIVYQILTFKQSQYAQHADDDGCITCPVLHIKVPSDQAHIDHVKPNTFKSLVLRFMQDQGLSEDHFELTWTDGVIGCLLDESMSKRWQVFHQANAVLQVVSARANLSVLSRKDSA